MDIVDLVGDKSLEILQAMGAENDLETCSLTRRDDLGLGVCFLEFFMVDEKLCFDAASKLISYSKPLGHLRPDINRTKLDGSRASKDFHELFWSELGAAIS